MTPGAIKNCRRLFLEVKLFRLNQFYFGNDFHGLRDQCEIASLAHTPGTGVCQPMQTLCRFLGANKLAVILFILSLAFVSSAQADPDEVITNFTQADSNIGERLFLETRFAQFFFTNSSGDANFQLTTNDPVMAVLETISAPVPGPFAATSLGAMNCRQCHLVDEEGYGPYGNNTLGNRTYADFARHSPVPEIGDGRTHTSRNSPMLVESLSPSQSPQFLEPGFLFSPTSNYDALMPGQPPLFLHRDGQFASAHDLIIDTLTGRNYGWRPTEYATALAHIAHIIRDDDGRGYLASQARGGQFSTTFSGLTAYRNIFSGYASYLGDPRFISRYLISPQYRLDMNDPKLTDDQILQTVAALIQVYLESLTFSRETNNAFNGSPYDVFLMKNGLPQQPAANETSAQYARRLLRLVTQLSQPQFVTDPDDGEFTTHAQSFQFGPAELEGLKIFLAEKNSPPGSGGNRIGNCAACHAPPAFTDFIFHNTGATEEEYDAVHGLGSFQNLLVPEFAVRESNYDAYLPPTPNHPQATGRFEMSPTTNNPGEVDLGLWNVFANPDFPAPQAGLRQILPKLLGLISPQITVATMSGNQFAFTGTNGPPGGTYYVLISTNLALPLADWTVMATNTFDAQGHFHCVSSIASDASQEYYRLSLAMPSTADVLPRTIALFKTPSLRDLGHSSPYLHTGRMDSIEDLLRFYQNFSNKARAGEVRNAATELRDISLDDTAIAPLAAFLRSLDEDYTD
ncbi:MAG: hypothetical protein WDN00_01010 [Limisphaerales bacterium]